MTVKEQKHLFVTPALAPQVQVIPKFLPDGGLAAGKLELSLREMRRLLAAYRRDGPAGMVHSHRVWPSQLPLLLKIPAKGDLAI